jgi:hypothetical protein
LGNLKTQNQKDRNSGHAIRSGEIEAKSQWLRAKGWFL